MTLASSPDGGLTFEISYTAQGKCIRNDLPGAEYGMSDFIRRHGLLGRRNVYCDRTFGVFDVTDIFMFNGMRVHCDGVLHCSSQGGGAILSEMQRQIVSKEHGVWIP